MNLLIDVGNQRLKWVLDNGVDDLGRQPGGVLELGSAGVLDELSVAFDGLDPPAGLWVSCVSGPQPREWLTRYAGDAWGLEPRFIVSRAREAGVTNGYPVPQSLGCDRWAALVAAAREFPANNAVVVDAGTAVTVDLLSADGEFFGGVIFPGLATMRNSLNTRTENIRVNGKSEHTAAHPPVATNTRDAVLAGTKLALVGGVLHAIDRQAALLEGDSRVVVTGGDGDLLAAALREGDSHPEVVHRPDLVLRGLRVLAAAESR